MGLLLLQQLLEIGWKKFFSRRILDEDQVNQRAQNELKEHKGVPDEEEHREDLESSDD